jgi:hypothetical protein
VKKIEKRKTRMDNIQNRNRKRKQDMKKNREKKENRMDKMGMKRN